MVKGQSIRRTSVLQTEYESITKYYGGHNPKVADSNPAPATLQSNVVTGDIAQLVRAHDS
jgi:hypothetical protein